MRVVNLSHPIEPNLADDHPSETATEEVEAITLANPLRRVRLSIELQTGTHIETPFHIAEGELTLDKVPLERYMGMATVVHLPHKGAFSEITAVDLAPFAEAIRQTRRVIIYADWYRRWKTEGYFTDHPVLTTECAEYLARCGVTLVGVDFPSVDRFPYPVHTALLGRGVLLIENLANYDFLTTNTVELLAIPLEIVGQGGSPVRALAIEKDATD